MKWLERILLKIPFIQKFIEWSKSCEPESISPMSVYSLGVFFWGELKKSSLNNRAASLSYSFILAIFPTVIFIFTLIPFIPIDGFQDQLMKFTALVLPTDTFKVIKSTILDIVKNQNGKLLSFGFISALIFATNGTHKMMVSFNKSSLIIETRTWFKQRVIAIILTLVIAFSVFLCIGMMVGGEVVLNFARKSLGIEKNNFIYYVVQLMRWVVFVVMYLITISFLFQYGPSHVTNWKFFSPGAILSTILAVLTFIGFAFYINKFGRFNKVYGSIGTLVVVMIWMNLNAYIILIGYELNASIELSKRKINYISQFSNFFKESQ